MAPEEGEQLDGSGSNVDAGLSGLPIGKPNADRDVVRQQNTLVTVNERLIQVKDNGPKPPALLLDFQADCLAPYLLLFWQLTLLESLQDLQTGLEVLPDC